MRVNAENISTGQLNQFRSAREIQQEQGFSKDPFRGSVEIQPFLRVVDQTEGIISLHDVQVVLPVQHCKTERTLNLFGHVTQAVEVEGFHLFDELDSNIAICLDVRIWEFQSLAKETVIVERPIMGQRKGHPLGVPSERMIILKL